MAPYLNDAFEPAAPEATGRVQLSAYLSTDVVSRRRRSRVRWALLGLLSFMTGCGNAYQHLSMGEWREVGTPEAPERSSDGEFVVTTHVEGTGRAVRAGDLVKAKVVLIEDPPDHPSTSGDQDAQIIWLWTGREPQPRSSQEAVADMDTFGSLGSRRARRAFIGRQLHEQFEIRLEDAMPGSGDQIPLRGIIAQRFATLTPGVVGTEGLKLPEWSGLPLTQSPRGRPAAKIEILDICDARLLHRTAELSQVGLIVTSGDVGYAFRRHGILGWTAIDAHCPSPDKDVRFEAGPFYYSSAATDRSRLADWSSSYVRLRPPQQHPEEWEVAPRQAWSVADERLAPLRSKIRDLQLQQTRIDAHCRITKECESSEQAYRRQQELNRLRSEEAQRRTAIACEIEKKCD